MIEPGTRLDALLRETLKSPESGLARLENAIASLDDARMRRRSRLQFALGIGGAVTALALLAVSLWQHDENPRRLTEAIVDAARPAIVRGAKVANGAAIEMPGGNGEVRFFWIMQLSDAASAVAAK